MQINRKQLRYIYNRFGFTRPSFAFYPENSATPGKRATYGEARVGIMTNGAAGIMVEQGTTNLIPLAKQKFAEGIAHQGAVVTLTQGIAVPEWGAVDATRIQTSGGDRLLKYVLDIERPPAGALRAEQIYIKNTGTTTVRIYSNVGDIWVNILPGESKLVKMENIIGDGVRFLQIQFNAPNVADSLDFIAWRPQTEAKPYCTTWTNGTRAPETISVPILFTPQTGGSLSFRVDVTDKCKRQVAGEYPALLWVTRSNSPRGLGLALVHSSANPTFALETRNDDGVQTGYESFSDSLISSGIHDIEIEHDIIINAIIVKCDGTEVIRLSNPQLPSGWGRAYLGSSAAGTYHADAMFGGIKMMAADSTVLSDILFNGPDFIRKARTIQL